jgi:hypothetical protein
MDDAFILLQTDATRSRSMQADRECPISHLRDALRERTYGYVALCSSGGRGIRTHGDVAATMVFKTIAIGH